MTVDRSLLWLVRMDEAARQALTFVEGIDRASFNASPMLQHAVAMSVLNVGEAASRLVAVDPELAALARQVEWQQIRAMRNVIAHGYFSIDFDAVWDAVHERLPELIEELAELIAVVRARTGQ